MSNAAILRRQSLGRHTLARVLQPLHRFRWLIGMGLLALGALFSFFANSQVASGYKTVSLSSNPLYATATGDKPTLALALSVEFPTVGAQYVRTDGITGALPDATNANTEDPTYSNTNDYLGYYDADSCYAYKNTPEETPATGFSATDYKRFDRTDDPATAHQCKDAFSGNFLNWASNSAIDMLRLALSGGDRYIDTETLTILQRASLPDGDPICMWNSSNFPAKRLQKDGGGTGKYWGAVPKKMMDAANGSDIWIANTLNRIYFGTSKTSPGDCNQSASYSLNVRTPNTITAFPYQKANNAQAIFNGASCANEGGNCIFTGRKEVLFGADTVYDSRGRVTATGGWLTFVGENGADCSVYATGTRKDPAPNIPKSCFVKDYKGTLPGDAINQKNALNNDGFFYSRVSVCGVDGSGALAEVRDYGVDKDGTRAYCTRYPSGKYKPTGVIQKYSEQLRLAAFGYLMDQTASYSSGRYGGVLRAPMKYVGQKTFDIYGQDNTPTSGNPNAEWNTTTGVFNGNPDNDSTQAPAISGVINYLNKFGRTGPVPGRYKRFDPIGELYYETLRYLQGLDPSADAISGVDMKTAGGKALYDGFPVYTDWSKIDPYKDRSKDGNYACLRSNVVVIGDINTHDGNRFPSSDPTKNIVNALDWRTVVQNFEKNLTSQTYIDGSGTTRNSENPNGANNNVPSGSQTSAIMGAAYWAHSHDIRGTSWTDQPDKQRPGLRVKTFTFDVNENGGSTNDNTRRTSNQLFMAAKYGGYEADSTNIALNPYNVNGNPFRDENNDVNNNVWQRPTQKGEAASYYLQSDAKKVLAAFDSIFGSAADATRSIAGAASQSKNLTTDGGVTYQGAFDATDWSGDLLALPVNLNSDNNQATTPDNPLWSASDKLMALGSNAATIRNIVVGTKGANPATQAVNFAVGAIEASLKADLNKASPTSAADGLADQRLAYLRGDRTQEGATFRIRKKLLGDIVNSAVVYSGVPVTNITAAGYADFYAANKNRVPAVFVGANDGMLHAFNATTGQTDSGKELFAYIPSWMGPKLSALTSKTYLSNHQSYVDGSSAVTEAQVGTGSGAADWKTVLVGSTGAGGRGVFALDVTNPAAFSASNVMWEFSGLNDPDMGYVVGRPQILKLRTSAASDSAVYKYFAVVASGVNNSLNDGTDLSNATGRPALFLLDLGKPAGTAWALNTNYYKLSLPAADNLSKSVAPGLLNFTPVFDRFSAVAAIFMGDLQGNLWKLDFAKIVNKGKDDWTMPKLSAYVRSVAAVNTPYPLFIAKDAGGATQPITAAPSVHKGEGDDVSYVAFGTGKYLEATDRSATTTQSIYAVLDDPSENKFDTASPVTSAIAGRGRLQAGVAATAAKTVKVPAFTWGRPASDSDMTKRAGFYFDFPVTGERQVSDAKVLGDNFIFGSLIPSAVGSGNTCGADGGSGNQWIVNIDTGAAVYRTSTVGLLGPPILQTLVPATVLTEKDNSGRQIRTITSQIISVGSTGTSPGGTTTTNITVGRLSWRQINNYQNLR
ncbi:pilus assembly protein [Sphingomonas sp. NCPPB 2930]